MLPGRTKEILDRGLHADPITFYNDLQIARDNSLKVASQSSLKGTASAEADVSVPTGTVVQHAPLPSTSNELLSIGNIQL
jgi:hypothetical protein